MRPSIALEQSVMAGLVPAIHAFALCKKDVDTRIRGHDMEAS
jgi:hypothetical protein